MHKHYVAGCVGEEAGGMAELQFTEMCEWAGRPGSEKSQVVISFNKAVSVGDAGCLTLAEWSLLPGVCSCA